jgi:exopolyphosphatase/guanosine-5'-triphosphate,3'-diphosphate pyrophosphatase
VCDRSLREGVIVDWMLAYGLIENRWRYQGSIRQRSILHESYISILGNTKLSKS